ncbi:ABC transporter ATP-binding protein [Fusibacter paucivorans]|uniref:ABC transporter ATP-binding protein n=1 Tax=Fusibacter paucivorans TaxID=76009 RepID=A0ABS5PJI4_9FIRM|nr:ABC transporter ATP-binding protein [Fusibacter paucivorans]MBS7525295.1 ABC transporter ATP-binding protein [Fusibacter paucivorans]
MSRIELAHINKHYGSNHVLKDINLTIEDGDFMTLLGPSGCGKTTTLRVIAGLERPESGRLLIDGEEKINSETAFYSEPSERNLNLVFQSYALWPHLTVFENVAFGLKIKKLNSMAITKHVTHALERMHIGELAKRYPNELSGGQQQRVAIARAIAYSPQLLLLDEPLSNLDAKLRMDMRVELKRLHQELGTTIVYVTHDQVEALTMSTKIAVFSKGCITQLATPKELYMNPVNLVNADFIGNPRINFIEAMGKKIKDGIRIACSLGDYEFDREAFTDEIPVEKDFACIIGIRPEQITIAEAQGETLIPAIVDTNQFAGSETLITVKIGEESLMIKEIGMERYRVGQTVYLEIKPERCNVYAKASGQLIKCAGQ